jgi:hypothetical protein
VTSFYCLCESSGESFIEVKRKEKNNKKRLVITILQQEFLLPKEEA